MAKTSARQRSPKASRPHMPGYGQPTGVKGLMPWTWAEQRLRRSHNYWLITVRADAKPHAMPIWGIWVDRRFYFSTGGQSRKAKNLAANASCIVCTENAAEAVVVEGTAAVVSDAPLIRRLQPLYQRKYKPWKLDTEMGPIFEVRPHTAFALREKTFKAATRWQM